MTKQLRFRPALLASALVSLFAIEGQTDGQTLSPKRSANIGLHAVPAPGEVNVDGVLAEGEWDRSGEILCTKDARTLLETESCRVSAMYGAEFLYLSFHFKDPTPMTNTIDPKVMSGNGWRGDAVQLRSNMNGYITHVDAWYFAKGNEPAMSIAYTDYGKRAGPHTTDRPLDGIKGGGKLAFKKDADGAGYVQELAVPWSLITKDRKQPSAGEQIALGLELIWGDPSNPDWPKSRVVDNFVAPGIKSDFWWTNDKGWGLLTLESKGNLKLPTPAWLRKQAKEPQAPVAMKFMLPEDGYVTIALEDAKGNRVRSLVGETLFKAGENTVYWDGLNDRNDSLPAGEYKWVGLRRGALGVKWITSFYQPNTALPWVTGDGRGGWGPDHGSLHGVASGAGRLYFAGSDVEAGVAVFAVDPVTGKKLWSRKQAESDGIAYAPDDGTGRVVVWAYSGKKAFNSLGIANNGVAKFDAATGEWLPLPDIDGKSVLRRPLLAKEETAAGFAADTSSVFLAVAGKGEVRQFDVKVFGLTRTIALKDAAALFAPNDGSLLVATPTSIIRVNLKDGSQRTLCDANLANVQRLTQGKDGTVYASLGAPTNQVATFSSKADGTLTTARVLGKEGGRPATGLYDPIVGFRLPAGVAVDDANNLWVIEEAEKPGLHPRRTSVWTADGTWKRDFIGDTFYGGGGVVDPLDPTTAWYHGLRFKLDPETRQHTLVDLNIEGPPSGKADGIEAIVKEGNEPTSYAVAHDGRTYLMLGRKIRLVSRKRPDGRWGLCAYIDPIRKIGWSDKNDDFDVQLDEVTRGGEKDDWGKSDYWGSRPSAELTQYFSKGIDKPGLRLTTASFTAGGTPVYDFSKFEPMAGEVVDGIGLKDGSYAGLSTGARGEYFSEVRKIQPSADLPRVFWYRGAQTGRWTSRLPSPGVVLFPFQSPGTADAPADFGGEIFCTTSDFGQRYLFTSDMLLVGKLFRDGRESYDAWPSDPKIGFDAMSMTPGQESFHGFFTRAVDGRYLLTIGFTDCRLFEVTGLETLKRMNGSVSLTTDQLAIADEIRQIRLASQQTPVTGPVVLTQAPTKVQIDGALSDWGNKPTPQAEIKVDSERGAKVYTYYDAQNLYVAWDVMDPTPLFPNGASRPEIAFKGGDSVDLMWRPIGQTLNAKATRAGDLRLLITSNGSEQPLAMLYRPVSDAKQPYVFDAFEGADRGNAVKMDEVRPAPEVRTATKKSMTGYVVEAAIPWSLLGDKPSNGAEGGVDFGVLFGDPANAATSLRSYWHNRKTNITSDVPSEAALAPDQWGRWTTKPMAGGTAK